MEFTIRKSVPEDLPEILKIYERARLFMGKTGNPDQWGKDWPPEELIREDIENGDSYVTLSESGKIVCTFFYRFGNCPEKAYEDSERVSWTDSSPYGVIHRIASSGEVKGAGKYTIGKMAEKSGHLRIDTHKDNRIMQRLLEDLGFVRCGSVLIDGTKERIAFEKSSGVKTGEREK